MARTGLRMMPTFPWSSLKFRTVGFPSVRLQGWHIRPDLPGDCEFFASYSLPPPFVHPLAAALYPVLSPGTRRADAPPFKRLWPLYPRGPRSGPGYSVPVHPYLIGPIRPTRRHIATSPQSGLCAMPSLCALRRLGDQRVVPCFRWHTVSACRLLEPREAHRLHASSSFADSAGLRPGVMVSALPTNISSHSDSSEAFDFGALLQFAYATTCEFACPPVGADQAFT